jgi:hypothetical protein
LNNEVPFVRKYFEGRKVRRIFVWMKDVKECAAQTKVRSGLGAAVPNVKFPQRVQSKKNINEVEFSGDYTRQ